MGKGAPREVMSLALVTAFSVLAAGPANPANPGPREKLRLGIDYRWWGRNVEMQGMQTTRVGPNPTGVGLDVQWFPASYFVDDRGADVGISLRIDMAPDYTLGIGGSNFTGSATQLRTGMLFRLPFRYAEPSVHLGLHVFEGTMSPFASDGTRRPVTIPNVSFQGPRFGLAVRLLEFWRITFEVSGGATWLIGLGEIGTTRFFPDARGSAFDGKASLAFRTWTWLDVRIGVDVTVHALTLGNGATATDAYYGVTFGIVFKGVP